MTMSIPKLEPMSPSPAREMEQLHCEMEKVHEELRREVREFRTDNAAKLDEQALAHEQARVRQAHALDSYRAQAERKRNERRRSNDAEEKALAEKLATAGNRHNHQMQERKEKLLRIKEDNAHFLEQQGEHPPEAVRLQARRCPQRSDAGAATPRIRVGCRTSLVERIKPLWPWLLQPFTARKD